MQSLFVYTQIWSRRDFEMISEKVHDVLPHTHYFYRYGKPWKLVKILLAK